MTKNNINHVINLLSKAGRLKGVKRTGWVLKGIKNVESVSDHTWRMGLLIMLLTPKDLNKEKLLEMNTIHDLGEINIGDIKWETGKKVIASQQIKHQDEEKAMEEIFKDYPDKQKYISLFNEFNHQKTKEAKFLKQIDKLEMALQALEYEQEGQNTESLNEFWENAEKYLKGKELEPYFEELQRIKASK